MKIGVIITIRDDEGNLLELMSHSSSMEEIGIERGIALYSPIREIPKDSQIEIRVIR